MTQLLSLSAGSYKLAFTGLFIGSNTTINYSIAGLAGTLTGSQIAGGHSFDFNVTGPTTNYLLSFTGFARGPLGVAAVDNVSVNQVTAVPGPEAGAGLGALAMAGVAVWARRRRTVLQQNA
ncbi:hypothetical protein [Aliirhizobium smilacinae]|uniref:PEP-CTERM sorting domain-containing protein n=1 Tax=Aliirhizobium smilacinae TaxID=1395944 RepID=A0A5C4XQV9_9HYPH|nr:hypothetical protein [Rhizobium smilacinae]TNM65341.1 hypothetical protein FHP24_03435 [Rhizobium smilacinae]